MGGGQGRKKTFESGIAGKRAVIVGVIFVQGDPLGFSRLRRLLVLFVFGFLMMLASALHEFLRRPAPSAA